MRPSIRDYNDYRKFLREYVQWMGSQDRKYSLRWIAMRSGFSSPSMLSMVMSGQRLLPRDKVAAVSSALKLLTDEEEYLRLLVELDDCEDPKERARLEKLLIQDHRGGLFQEPEDDGYEVFSRWYLPAIRELVALKEFRSDPFWIAGRLGISPIEARDGLNTLLRIGMIDRSEHGVERSVPSIQPRQPASKARMDDFNRQLAARAVAAIELSREHRYFNGLTVSMSQAAFKKVPDILARLISEIDMLAEADQERDEVALLNVQFFSLTAKCENTKSVTDRDDRMREESL